MEKFCIFCGNPPINKNREHLLPKWLIEMTGNSNRLGTFGPIYENDTLELKHFPFNKFVLPSCYKCNHEFGLKIEGKAKEKLRDLLDKKPLSMTDLNLLLTWFDKIRIGSALTTLYHLKNPYKTTPPFFINDGSMTRDRMLLVFKSKYEFDSLNVFGIGTNFIINYPICIGLIINNYGFINISKTFLLHRAFGLPFPEIDPMYLEGDSDGNYEIKLLKAISNRIGYPVLDYEYNLNCTEILQPIISDKIIKINEASILYGQSRYEYIFGKKSSQYGEFFYRDNLDIKPYPKKKSRIWIPNELDLEKDYFQNFIAYHTIQIQNSFIESGLKLSKEISDSTETLLKSILEINNLNLSRLPLFQNRE
jgi:hypothetical protein